MAAICLALGAALWYAVPANALEHSGQTGGITFSVFAPDWTWQNRAVNVMFVLENRGMQDAAVGIAMHLPKGHETDFQAAPENLAHTVNVPVSGTIRAALTGILARPGVPRQVYPCTLSIKSNGAAAQIPYPLRTIRGAVVSSARWAMYLPVATALCWAVVMAVVMALLTSRRAWLDPVTPICEPKEKPGWIDLPPK
jgi:hypothetical protein